MNEFDKVLEEIENRIQYYRDGIMTAMECRTVIVDMLTNVDIEPLIEDHREKHKKD